MTGLTALNIPSKDGTGDWHFFQHFVGMFGRKPTFFAVAGKNFFDSTPVLSDKGVFECSNILKKYGAENVPDKVYAANHFRAYAELLAQCVAEDLEYKSAYPPRDWFAGDSEREQVLFYLKKAATLLDDEKAKDVIEWVSAEEI